MVVRSSNKLFSFEGTLLFENVIVLSLLTPEISRLCCKKQDPGSPNRFITVGTGHNADNISEENWHMWLKKMCYFLREVRYALLQWACSDDLRQLTEWNSISLWSLYVDFSVSLLVVCTSRIIHCWTFFAVPLCLPPTLPADQERKWWVCLIVWDGIPFCFLFCLLALPFLLMELIQWLANILLLRQGNMDGVSAWFV